MIRAKFRCHSVEKMLDWRSGERFLYTAKLEVVADDSSSENKRFWDATPRASIQLTSILEDAFEPGKSYYVDFTEAF